MTDRFELVPMDAFLTHRKEFFVIDDIEQYKRVTVKLHAGGIVLRDRVYGSQLRTKKQQATRAGDLLVAEIDAKVGGVGIVPPELAGAIVSSHYFLYKIDEAVCHPKYLEFYIRSGAVERQFQEFVQGSTNYASVRAHHTLELQIPLPPLDEQRRIVARVEALAALIEEAQGLRIKARDEAEAFTTSSVISVFERNSGRSGWEPQPLGKAAEIKRGRFAHRPRNAPQFYDGDIPFIQIGDISASNRYIQRYSQTLNKDGLGVSRMFPSGTVVIAITGATIGATGILTFDSCFPDSIVGMTARKNVALPKFIYWALENAKWEALAEATQTTQPNINLRILNKLTIPIPPLPEQQHVVDHLEYLQSQVDKLTAIQEETQAELDALLPSVLDLAFKGEL